MLLIIIMVYITSQQETLQLSRKIMKFAKTNNQQWLDISDVKSILQKKNTDRITV